MNDGNRENDDGNRENVYKIVNRMLTNAEKKLRKITRAGEAALKSVNLFIYPRGALGTMSHVVENHNITTYDIYLQ